MCSVTLGAHSSAVRSDDFTVLGRKRKLFWFWKELSTKFKSKHRGRIGPWQSYLKDMRILNRISSWNEAGITYEADRRHVEISVEHVGIGEDHGGVSISVDKSAEDPRNRRCLANEEESSELLSPSGVTKYRGILTKMKYLDQDGSDIQFAVKEWVHQHKQLGMR